MSHLHTVSPLHAIVFVKFGRAFGNAKRIAGKDRQWSLLSPASLVPIHVLVNGSYDAPMVWVFDAHDTKGGVTHQRVRDGSEIDALVAQIQKRVRMIGRRDGDGEVTQADKVTS